MSEQRLPSAKNQETVTLEQQAVVLRADSRISHLAPESEEA
jgi:hypothetical protein